MSVHILRIPRSDDPGYILVRSECGGKDILDIKLMATEGECPYVTQVKAKRTSSLRSKNAPCTQEEFDTALSAILRGKPSTGIEALEVVAAVDSGKSVSLTIRKRTEGITQRFGTITLSGDEEQPIELFEWCGLAVQAKNDSQDELSALNSKFDDQQKVVAKLTKQLEELLVAKKEHEDLLLDKVAVLLNEKKLKIRDQQRLLSTAKVDKQKLAEVQATRRSGGKSAANKRKRKGPSPADETDSEDDAFDKMELDTKNSEEDDAMTPDEETEDETEDEEDAPPPPPSSKVKGRIGGKVAPGRSEKATPKIREEASTGASSSPAAVERDYVMPPVRQLPFQKKAAPIPAPQPVPQLAQVDGADEETESDDEL